MSKHYVNIESIDKVTHDTLSIKTDKPDNYIFKPGQATMVAIDKKGWKGEKRPFTFTSLPEDRYIEFVIKTYPEHDGTTDKLLDLRAGDNLILFDIFGTIVYKGEGVFIAGGAGVTPFISILRDLHKKGQIGNNKLIFANKTKDDIILKDDFEKILGDNFINILSDEKTPEYSHGFVNEEFLRKNIDDVNKYFYICGPPPMLNKLQENLTALNVDKKFIIKEEF